MKHSILFLSILSVGITVLFSCDRTSGDYLIPDTSTKNDLISVRSDINNSPIKGHEVTQKMAELFISSDKSNPPVKRIDPYEIDDVTCFYIFNFEEGFKIVSADTRVYPILAESNEENLYVDKAHEGLRVWLEETAEMIRIVKNEDVDTKEDYSTLWQDFVPNETLGPKTRSWPVGEDSVWIKTVDYSYTPTTVYAHVSPLIQTKWGQGNYWNVNMPIINGQHCQTGCAAVAISQILYYFHALNNTPNDLWHSISITTINSGNTVTLSKSQYNTNSARWLQMPLYNGISNAQYQYVSDLMLDIGERVQIHYGPSLSFVILDDYDLSIPNISQCGISSSYGTFNFTTVKNNLANGQPLIAVATTSSGAVGSHVWIIDGCDDCIRRIDETTTYNFVAYEDIPDDPLPVAVYSNDDMLTMFPNAYDGMQFVNTSYSPYQSIRMNWGYDGVGDSADYGVLSTSNWYLGNTNYIYNRHIYYNISTNQLY